MISHPCLARRREEVRALRSSRGATVSMPIGWKELKPGLKPDQRNVVNLGERLQRLPKDPWRDFFNIRQAITKKLQRELGLPEYFRFS
jgi:DNA primase